MARDGSEWQWLTSSDAPESPTFVGNRTVPAGPLVLVSGDCSRFNDFSPAGFFDPFDGRKVSLGSVALLTGEVSADATAERFEFGRY